MTSVACAAPPVNFHKSAVSMVPKQRSPRSARARAPFTLSSSQRSLVALKYASSTRPVFSRTHGSFPCALSSLHIPAVRRSCQTMALWMGRPERRSQSSVVSRWLVMPMACRSDGFADAWRRARPMTLSVAAQMSSRSCSTQPGLGKIWRNSRLALPLTERRWSRTSAVTPVVPSSIARTYLAITLLLERTGPRRGRLPPPRDRAAAGGRCAGTSAARPWATPAASPAGVLQRALRFRRVRPAG